MTLNNHYCSGKGKSEGLCCVEEDEGELWVSANDEYEYQVNFCPFCGKEAKVKVKERENELTGNSG